MLANLKGRLLAALFTLLLSAGAGATPATYRFTGDIIGTLNGVPVNGLLTLNFVGDTNDLVFPGPAQFLNTGVATFNLAAPGDFTVSTPSYVFSRPDLGFTGFGVPGLPTCCDIIQIHDSALLGYDLNNPIGPILVASNPSLADFHDVPTSAGLFTVTVMRNATFEAIIGDDGTVPEPGLPSLLVLAGGAAWFARRRAQPPMTGLNPA